MNLSRENQNINLFIVNHNNMKKNFLGVAFVFAALAANAQTTLKPAVDKANMDLSVKAGDDFIAIL